MIAVCIRKSSSQNNTAINLKQGADAVSAGQANEGGNAADKAGGIGINISAGTSSSQAKQQSSANSAKGSNLNAGGNVTIQATRTAGAPNDTGKDSDLTIQGSDIAAGGKALLKADDQVNIVAAQNTTQESNSSKNSSGSIGVGFQLGAARWCRATRSPPPWAAISTSKACKTPANTKKAARARAAR